ncbi:MAG TPA: hypothetical protein VHV74_09285 [Pseudonocardiaceae bacterium]|nr:hypothetical protein [Pseudonocardiaceae bacterium]
MVNPQLMAALARERQADFYRAIPRHRPPGRRRHANAPRQRVGWLLIEVGLRLTAEPH